MPQIGIKHKGDMLFETTVGGHTLTIDVPPEMKGKERALTPPDLFLASLASCILSFVVNYCNNVGIDTEDMSVDLSFDELEDPKRFANLKVAIKIPKGDYAGREKAILSAVEQCPVYETIRAVDRVETVIEEIERVPVATERFWETYRNFERDPELGERHFNVPIEYDGDVCFKMTMDVSKHVVLADSVEAMGGTDRGASPLFLLLGTIGACIGTIIKFWAMILYVKIDNLRIFSRGHINLAGLLGLHEDKYKPGFDQLEPVVEITSDEDQTKIDQLMEKVDKYCPVFFNLRNKSPIEWKIRRKKPK